MMKEDPINLKELVGCGSINLSSYNNHLITFLESRPRGLDKNTDLPKFLKIEAGFLSQSLDIGRPIKLSRAWMTFEFDACNLIWGVSQPRKPSLL